MQAVKTANLAPTQDGDINRYVSAEGRSQSWFRMDREVIFVNGMGNSPRDHRASALALSLMQGCPVVGIYNQTDGFWTDLGQCLRDKITLVSAQAGRFATWKASIDRAIASGRPGTDRVDFVADLIAENRATLALYRYLVSLGSARLKTTAIYCHSQGNLVTSNALTAVALALGEDAIAGMKVNSYGSPVRFWPAGLQRTNNAFTFDLVSLLDYRFGFSSAKVGLTKGLFAHGFATYMKHDAEFVVNRFRWGSFRMTASMDERGLATFLYGLGNNPTRLLAIFKWLNAKHFTDSDDVAMHYLDTLQSRDRALLNTLARSSPALISELITALDRGWTTRAEHAHIATLRALI